MAAPTLQKTWQFVVNQDLNAQVDAATTRRYLLWKIKETLKSATFTNAWQVRYSCSSTVAGAPDDLVDRWVSYSNVVFNSGDGTPAAHSWIVLRNTVLNAELLITCNTGLGGTTTRRLRAKLALGGNWFTGGTTTVDPTSAVAFELLDSERITEGGGPVNAGWWCLGTDSTTNFNCALHGLMSSDGECTRIGVFIGGIPVCWISIEKLWNPATGLTYPIFATWQGDYVNAGLGNTDVPMFYEYMFDLTNPFADNPPWRAGEMYHGGARFPVSYITERVNSTATPTYGAIGQRGAVYNTIEAKYALTGIGVYSAASGKKGRHGAMYDLWAGPSSFPVGRGYPNDTTPDFVHWRNIVMPWNGTAMLTA